MSKLNEGSFQENVECPYCGWGEAESYSDRSGVGEKIEGGGNWEYTVREYCDLCGWNFYGIDDDSFSEIVEEIYGEYEDEEETEKNLPEQEITVKPYPQNVATAKKIIPMLDKLYDAFDEDSDDYEAVAEFIWDWHPEEKQKRTVKDFLHGLVNRMFERDWA